MKVILAGNVANLGNTGDMVSVKGGYARNYLIPRGLAMVATTGNVKTLGHQKRLVQNKVDKEIKAARTVAEKLENVSITLQRHAGEEDKLFGSVTTRDISDALAAEGLDIHTSAITMDEAIKTLGVYNIPIKLHTEISVEIKVWVVAAA
jgi:large subunit ribosomal protein L9